MNIIKLFMVLKLILEVERIDISWASGRVGDWHPAGNESIETNWGFF